MRSFRPSIPPRHLSLTTQAAVKSTWYLAYGRVRDGVDDITWQDECIAVGKASPVLSPQQRFVVVGDVWLSNRDRLLLKLDGRPESETLTDTQIVAWLWERFGSKSLKLLVGMFAFAVWDRQRQVLWLVRDPVGARTLYHSTIGETRWVASRLHIVSKRVTREVDFVALRDYLCCAFVPGERTMWRDVRELRPGTALQLPSDRQEVYWELQEQATDSGQSLEWHAEQLRFLLEEIVKDDLPADKPVGAYLSGGLDSSCIVALMARLHSQSVHTYSIHFGSECANELAFSSMVAEHCGTEHHIINITPDQMWNLLPETMTWLDDPIGDPLTVPNLILGRAAQASVDVILNGEGGDPCFGGPKNQPMLLTSLYHPAIEPTGKQGGTPPNLVAAYLASFQKCFLDLPLLMRPEVWKCVEGEPSVFEAYLNGKGNYLNRLMLLNTRFKGADHILTKVSNLTAATGISGRSPLFDQRIVEMSLRIPPHYKLSGAQEKAVLKSAVWDLLPQQILTRPKSGMMVPVQLWFSKRWQRSTRALLLGRRAKIKRYLNQEVIRQWLDYQGDVWSRYGVKLWLVVSLELWLQAHPES